MYNRNNKTPFVRLKTLVLCVVMVVSMSLAGCTGVTELTDDESYEIARYMADKLLRYDKSFGVDELVYIDPTLPTKEPEATEAPSVSPGPEASAVASEQPGTDVPLDENGTDEKNTTDWSEFFTTDEWEITYSSYDTCQNYPKDSDTYTVEAARGKKLVVISFNVVNKTDHKIKIDLTDAGLNYLLTVGENEYKPLVTILDNGGLMFLNIKLKAHGKDNAVLIFEVPEGADLSGMRLDVSK